MADALSLPQPVSKPRFVSEATGALNAAASSLAITAAAGTLVFAPLGADAIGSGVAAAMVAAVVGGIIATLATPTPLFISSPRAATAVVLAGFVATVHRTRPEMPAEAVIALTGLMVITSGLLQMAAAAVRIGRLVRFVPFPVISGFTHGVALVLLLIYFPVMLGVASVPVLGWPRLDTFSWGIASVGVVTAAVAFLAVRLAPKAPTLFVALVVGLALQWAMSGGAIDATAVIHPGHLELPGPPFAPWSAVPAALRDSVVVGQLVSFSIATACVNTIDSLIGTMSTEARFGIRGRPDRDLFAQGLGNAMAGVCGGITITYSSVQAVAAHAGGARGRAAAPLSVAMLALLAFFAWEWLDDVALAIVGGLLVFVATRIADPWGFSLIRSMARERSKADGALRGAFLTYLLVALSILLLDIVSALAVGLAVAAAAVIRTMNQHVVRRMTLGPSLRSRRLVPPRMSRMLSERLHAVAAIELQGPLFFGTAERVLEEVEKLPRSVHYVVFDLQRVQAIDATASAVLARLHSRLAAEGRQIAICGSPSNVGAMGANLPPAFPDRDRAIEWVEDRLLADEDLTESANALRPAAFTQAIGLQGEQARMLLAASEERTLREGDILFRAGDSSDYLYFVLGGRVSIVHGARSSKHRVVTLMPGNVFGHAAFVDGSLRTATAICDSPSRILTLHRAAMAQLEHDAPQVVERLYLYLATELAALLRATDRQLQDAR